MTETKDLIIITASCGKNLELSEKFLDKSNELKLSSEILDLTTLDIPLFNPRIHSKENIPNKIKEFSWTRLSVRKYKNQFSKREDPRGDDYYWLAGEVVLDLKSKGYGPKNWPSDVSPIQDNKISLTPVEPDLFWRGNLEDLPKINNSFVNPS